MERERGAEEVGVVDQASQLRERNRKHAKKTRLRKKAMLEGMKDRLLELQNEVRRFCLADALVPINCADEAPRFPPSTFLTHTEHQAQTHVRGQVNREHSCGPLGRKRQDKWRALRSEVRAHGEIGRRAR